jgi:hypothetical protein
MAGNDPPRPSSAPSAPRRAPTERVAREPPRPAVDRLVTGVLVAHGPGPYRNEPNGAPSYFITVATDRGERTLWGREIQRALAESRTKPKPGDPVGVRENGIDPMTFVQRERDEKGHVISEKRADTPRPHWIIEHRSFFNERAAAAKVLRDPRASRHEAVRNHPELMGAYWALDSAAKIASQRIQHPSSREQFVALVREALAHATERGEPLPAPVRTNTVARAPASRKDEDLTR